MGLFLGSRRLSLAFLPLNLLVFFVVRAVAMIVTPTAGAPERPTARDVTRAAPIHGRASESGMRTSDSILEVLLRGTDRIVSR